MARAEMTFSVQTQGGFSVVPDHRLLETLSNILELKQIKSLEDLSIVLIRASVQPPPITPDPIKWSIKAAIDALAEKIDGI